MKYLLLVRSVTCLVGLLQINRKFQKRNSLWLAFWVLFAIEGFAGEPSSVSTQICDQDLITYETRERVVKAMMKV